LKIISGGGLNAAKESAVLTSLVVFHSAESILLSFRAMTTDGHIGTHLIYGLKADQQQIMKPIVLVLCQQRSCKSIWVFYSYAHPKEVASLLEATVYEPSRSLLSSTHLSVPFCNTVLGKRHFFGSCPTSLEQFAIRS